jgi:beta-lactamase regulating signal transducer with metallopeptidase domain
MTTFWQVGGVELWQLAGWTMLHFAWIGSVIGVVAFTCWLVTRRSPANVRYAVAIGCLCMLAGAPGGVAAWLVVHGCSNSVRGDAQVAASNGEMAAEHVMSADVHPRMAGDTAPGNTNALPTDAPAGIPSRPALPAIPMTAINGRLSQQLVAVLEPCARFLPWMWLLGAPLTFLLLTTGVVGAERLRRASRIINDGPIVEARDRLMQGMHVTRRVAVAVCERLAAPVLVGIVRPIILLPPAALTGWSLDEIEMVLVHELAHVRRWDNLVNLAQRIVESLLFFHPAVWLVSGWVRREREACCDAIVVGRTARPQAYAELLVALAAQMPRGVLFHPAASSAMAAGPLRARIRRILQLEDDPMLVSGKSFALLVGSAVVAATLSLLYLPARGQANESTTAGVKEIVAEGAEIAVTKDESHDVAKSDAPTGNALLEITSQNGQTIIADLTDGRLQLTADPKSADAKSSDNNAQPSKHKFPSLEEQKLADMAWKLLGLELEPIDEAYLKQVKALGYDGGVRVASVRAKWDDGIWPGDLLVGLHVWPTTSLKEAADVLNRDDLAELSPLKFYVVRPGHPSNAAFASGSEQDTVVTGRIAVSFDEQPTAQVEYRPQPTVETTVDEALKSDPNMSFLNQELMQVEYSLSEQGEVSTSGPERKRRLEKQLAAIRKQIGDYRQQVTQHSQQSQPPASPARPSPAAPMPIAPPPAIPSAPMPVAPAPAYPPAPPPTHLLTAAGDVRVGGKLLAEEVAADHEIAELRQKLLAAEMELQIKSTDAGGTWPASIENLQKQIAELQQSIAVRVQKKFAELMAEQMAGPYKAARQAAAEMAAAQIAFDRATKEHDELAAHGEAPADGGDEAGAGHALESAKRLDEAKRAFGERKQTSEEINRQFDELRREREAAAAQEAEAKQQAEQGQREAGDAEREAESERRQAEEDARREQGEARREAEAAKREAEDVGREAEQMKRPAEQAERERTQADHAAAVDRSRIVTMTYAERPPSAADGQPNAGRQMLEQIHRQLEEMDRQLEATKRQLQLLGEQKEALVAHANKLTKEIKQQNGDQQKP